MFATINFMPLVVVVNNSGFNPVKFFVLKQQSVTFPIELYRVVLLEMYLTFA